MNNGNATMAMTSEDFLDYVKDTKSKNTYKEYKRGIEKFSEWYGKTPNEILKERVSDWTSGNLFKKKRFSREIEKFHKWLITDQPNRKAYSINSARTYCLGILQLFRFYEMPVTIPTGSDVSKTVVSTKDFVPTPDQFRKMYRVASDLRSKLIISMGKDLAWRIGDFMKQRKDQLPNLEVDAPIPYDLITEKEDVIAKSFLSQETVDLLKEYLPTVKDNNNVYLFPSNGEGYFDPESVNRILRQLAEKAKIKIPKNKRLRFHALRKRFLSTCANLSVDVNTAKVLCGKSVEKSMLSYLSEVEHREAFIRVHQRLKLTATPMRKRRETTTELETKLNNLERLIHGIIAMGGKDLIEKAKTALELEDKDVYMHYKNSPISEIIQQLGKIRQRKQMDEYRKLIESNNNNNR